MTHSHSLSAPLYKNDAKPSWIWALPFCVGDIIWIHWLWRSIDRAGGHHTPTQHNHQHSYISHDVFSSAFWLQGTVSALKLDHTFSNIAQQNMAIIVAKLTLNWLYNKSATFKHGICFLLFLLVCTLVGVLKQHWSPWFLSSVLFIFHNHLETSVLSSIFISVNKYIVLASWCKRSRHIKLGY